MLTEGFPRFIESLWTIHHSIAILELDKNNHTKMALKITPLIEYHSKIQEKPSLKNWRTSWIGFEPNTFFLLNVNEKYCRFFFSLID